MLNYQRVSDYPTLLSATLRSLRFSVKLPGPSLLSQGAWSSRRETIPQSGMWVSFLRGKLQNHKAVLCKTAKVRWFRMIWKSPFEESSISKREKQCEFWEKLLFLGFNNTWATGFQQRISAAGIQVCNHPISFLNLLVTCRSSFSWSNLLIHQPQVPLSITNPQLAGLKMFNMVWIFFRSNTLAEFKKCNEELPEPGVWYHSI